MAHESNRKRKDRTSVMLNFEIYLKENQMMTSVSFMPWIKGARPIKRTQLHKEASKLECEWKPKINNRIIGILGGKSVISYYFHLSK